METFQSHRFNDGDAEGSELKHVQILSTKRLFILIQRTTLLPKLTLN